MPRFMHRSIWQRNKCRLPQAFGVVLSAARQWLAMTKAIWRCFLGTEDCEVGEVCYCLIAMAFSASTNQTSRNSVCAARG
ncbi:hypothetical protein EJ03DRAFT_206801 [Teratosphaeria nubilosa]|uniref:Uncharacterized protein n=1 Tax=Teratosphaeria nubilosa TaxID=161662 RepID=A0A6G1KZ02_9PEZI|nr:hypothetical protein EJ03DRAFT_206801 [Teratosphaeria nubilosa]